MNRLKNLDVSEVYEKIEKELRLDEKRMNRTALITALDEASENAKLAGYIMVVGKKERDKMNLLGKELCEPFRMEARKKLTQMKKDKKVDGQITIDMIDGYCINKFPEYKEIQLQLIDIKRVVELLKVFYEQWSNRASILQTIAKLQDGPSKVEVGERV